MSDADLRDMSDADLWDMDHTELSDADLLRECDRAEMEYHLGVTDEQLLQVSVCVCVCVCVRACVLVNHEWLVQVSKTTPPDFF